MLIVNKLSALSQIMKDNFYDMLMTKNISGTLNFAVKLGTRLLDFKWKTDFFFNFVRS